LTPGDASEANLWVGSFGGSTLYSHVHGKCTHEEKLLENCKKLYCSPGRTIERRVLIILVREN